MTLRIGLGHDTHRLAPGGPLMLGGVPIDHDRHAVGHSDADVLLHAITDALMGAAGLGDIGELFPDTDPANQGRDSKEMLGEAYRLVRDEGFHIINLDAIVFAERPKLSPHKQAIRQSIARVLNVPSDDVNVKAKTGESTGPVGEQQVIMAEAVVLLESILLEEDLPKKQVEQASDADVSSSS